jgi:hypothetical protein
VLVGHGQQGPGGDPYIAAGACFRNHLRETGDGWKDVVLNDSIEAAEVAVASRIRGRAIDGSHAKLEGAVQRRDALHCGVGAAVVQHGGKLLVDQPLQGDEADAFVWTRVKARGLHIHNPGEERAGGLQPAVIRCNAKNPNAIGDGRPSVCQAQTTGAKKTNHYSEGQEQGTRRREGEEKGEERGKV